MTNTEQVGTDPQLVGGVFSPKDARTVATWPAGTFVENLAVDEIGAVFVTLYSHQHVANIQ